MNLRRALFGGALAVVAASLAHWGLFHGTHALGGGFGHLLTESALVGLALAVLLLPLWLMAKAPPASGRAGLQAYLERGAGFAGAPIIRSALTLAGASAFIFAGLEVLEGSHALAFFPAGLALLAVSLIVALLQRFAVELVVAAAVMLAPFVRSLTANGAEATLSLRAAFRSDGRLLGHALFARPPPASK